MANATSVGVTVRMPTDREVNKAIRFTYAQAMLKSVFWASTSGMFLVGFAMRLGAGDALLGLMTTVPTAFIVAQILGAALTERGYNRKRLTVGFGLLVPASWFLIAGIPLLGSQWARANIPFLGGDNNRAIQLAVLIAMLAMANGALQISFSVRASWVGELIPARRRGRFFGYTMMFSGIVGMISSVSAGRVLDFIQHRGTYAFAGLFCFGALAAAGWALLFLPQADCPLPREEKHPGVTEMARRTFANRPLMRLAFANALHTLGSVSSPFVAAYLLRDVGLSYFQLGMLMAVTTTASLASAPTWGRLTERFGCRRIMALGWAVTAACMLVWFAIPPGASARALMLLPFTNLLAGMGNAAANVSHQTIVYKVSQPVGRSMQLALYYTFIILIGAPMPALGGWAVTALREAGFGVDLRMTFIATMVFYAAGAVAAMRLKEPGAVPAEEAAAAPAGP